MKMLFSAYRLDQYADSEGFIAQVAAIMSEYSHEVVVYVTDIKTGIQRRSKWPPTINELGDALDAAKVVIAGMKVIADKEAQGLAWDNQANVWIAQANHRCLVEV